MNLEGHQIPEEPRGDYAADSWPPTAEAESASGWVTTDVAAAALKRSPRRVREYIRRGDLTAKTEGEGVTKRWLVSVDSLDALLGSFSEAAATRTGIRAESACPPRLRRGNHPADAGAAVSAEELLETVQELQYRLGRAEARAELTDRAESTLREDLEREREERRLAEEERRQALDEASRLREELSAEHSKGFFRRLFGG